MKPLALLALAALVVAVKVWRDGRVWREWESRKHSDMATSEQWHPRPYSATEVRSVLPDFLDEHRRSGRL